MARHNNNEAYKLLELSDKSESDLDLPELIASPRKRKVRRKFRKTRSNSITNVQPACSCNIRVVTIWIAAFLLTTWIITLTWLAIVLHNEIQRLDSTVREVVASSQGVPFALQKCHTISKSLQQNQTLISSQIVALKLQLDNYTKDVSDMQVGYNKIQEKLNNVPEYLNVPQQLKDVSGSIANLGSQIKDIMTTVAALKDSKEKLETTSNILVQNVTTLRQSVSSLQNVSQVPVVANSEKNAVIENMLKVIDGIKNNITTINTTLSNNIQWIKDDLKKNNKNIESISNVGQNMSARVTTLEGICGKTASDQITLSTNIKGVSDELKTVSTSVQNHASQITEIQSQIHQLNQNTSDLTSALNMLNHSLDENRSYTQAFQDRETLHERDIDKTKTDSPSSTSGQAAVTPTQATSPAATAAAKPAILST